MPKPHLGRAGPIGPPRGDEVGPEAVRAEGQRTEIQPLAVEPEYTASPAKVAE